MELYARQDLIMRYGVISLATCDKMDVLTDGLNSIDAIYRSSPLLLAVALKSTHNG
jgi:hypothetical protein